MSDDFNSNHEAVWNDAWSWVIKQHECNNPDPDMQRKFARWLTADPSHKLAYEKANRIWLFAGFVPPVNEISFDANVADDE
ncbi:MAG: hypothetical protein B0W54_05120 [Cellvibrio sp. 79]|nr:MAG: hypothetical protein B0W54_05120 [Cellvibrio sp. 79]